jgi:hypothetical protein
MLGKVMSTVTFPHGGRVALAEITRRCAPKSARPTTTPTTRGLIRYAEGVLVALFFTRGAQPGRCAQDQGLGAGAARGLGAGDLSGARRGGHVSAAGATVREELERTKALALAAVRG